MCMHEIVPGVVTEAICSAAIPTVFSISYVTRIFGSARNMPFSVPSQHRTLDSGLVWLKPIARLNLIRSCAAVTHASDSSKHEFNELGIRDVDGGDQCIAIAMRTLTLPEWFPVLGGRRASIDMSVLSIIYWVKSVELSDRLGAA